MERKKYRCDMCNWKFSRNFIPSLCPYCGRAAIVLDEVKIEPMLKVRV